jgi:hypothetical protein
MLTPAARDQAISAMYTGIRAKVGKPRALRRAAITKGNKVYPMMQTDWKNELENGLLAEYPEVLKWNTNIFPPRSLICRVTTASPIQIIEKTPEKTSDDWSSCARIERNMLSRRQKMRGPLGICNCRVSSQYVVNPLE